MDHKAPDAFRTISEVADELDLPQHVLRFWESRFRDIKPMKRGGGRRYYRPDDVDLLRGIRHLLYGEGYTIRGVQRILREQGAKFVAGSLAGRRAAAAAWRERGRRFRRRSRLGNRDARRGKRPARPAGGADRPRPRRAQGRRRDAQRAAAQERPGTAHRAGRPGDPCGGCAAAGAMQGAPAAPAGRPLPPSPTRRPAARTCASCIRRCMNWPNAAS